MPKAAKKTVKKSLVKKTIATTTPKKRVAPKKAATAKSKTATKKATSNTIVLPQEVSRDALERSLDIRRKLDDYIHRSVYTIAYVSAVCFVLVGAAIAGLSLSTSTSTQALKAQLIEIVNTSDGTVSSTSEPSTTDPVNVIESPRFDFLTDVPNNLIDPIEVAFVASFVTDIRPKLVHIGYSDVHQLPIKSLIDNKYSVLIPTKELPYGYYELRVSYLAQDGSGSKVQSTGEFFIGSKEQEDIYNGKVDNSGSGSTTSGGDSTTTTQTETTVTEPTTTTEPKPLAEPIIKEPIELIDTTEDAVTDEPASEEVVFALIKPAASTLSNSVVIPLQAPLDWSYIELYARQLQARDYRFVTLATKRTDGWRFIVDTINLPNSDYEFQARSKFNGVLYQTKTFTAKVSNLLETEKTLQEPIQTSEIISITNTTETESETREFFDTTTVDFTENSTLEDDVERETDQLLTDNRKLIEDLLRRYAVALQSGDQILIDSIRRELESVQRTIMVDSFQNERTRDLADDLEVEIKRRVETLQERVTTFEEIRKERSSGTTAKDTDQDGISDFDEIRLYKTNPESVDTDNDGVTDGVEIARGYNPTSAEPEAVIEFESPRDSIGLERPDVLVVAEVTPVITEASEARPTRPVRTEIRGTALPNSFVTLYIFSTPTVVTIKTDADGSFVYTFDKELEDGRHDVYVAVTDNAGAIVAQSNPFSFVKRAQAFTPVDADEAEVVSQQTYIDDSASTYNAVFGIAILAFGVILLMLGIGLRHNKRPDEATIISEHVSAPEDVSNIEQNV